MERPNIVIVVLDTARADVFEPYGAIPGSTPVMADLAARGSAAPAMHAPSGWTLPSHVGMFLGAPPRSLGLARAPQRTPPSCRPVMEAHRRRVLPEVLRRNGYTTKGVSANLWITPVSGFGTGFDEFVTVKGTRSLTMSQRDPVARIRWLWDALRAHADDGADAAEQALERFAAADRTAPFFWFINLIECHSPYLPPRPHALSSPRLRLRAAELSRDHYTMGSLWKNCLGDLELSSDDLELMRLLYQRSIGQLDAWLGRLLERLDDAGGLDETLIVVTSDHGENFGEGGLIGHSFSLDQRLIHVPFISAGPGAPQLDRNASLIELPRIIAEAAGIENHPWTESVVEPGQAVIAQFDAPADANDLDKAASADWQLDDHSIHLLTSPQTAVRIGSTKLIRTGGSDVLYDLDTDPEEADPRPSSEAPAELVRALDAASAAGPPPPTGAEPGMDPGLESRMRLLGYL